MKKSKLLALCIVLVLVGSLLVTGALAASGTREEKLHYRDIKITLDGNELVPKDVDGDTVEPFIISGTTYLPVRALSGALGLAVDWNDKESTVVLQTEKENQYDKDEDIKELYKKSECVVTDILDNGGKTVVVYHTESAPKKHTTYFDWFSRADGARSFAVSCMVDKYELGADGGLNVLSTGEDSVSGNMTAPRLYGAYQSEVNGALKMGCTEEGYYLPLSEKLSIGKYGHASLTGVALGNTELASWAVSLTFGEQAGYESEFHAWKPSMPRMEVENKNGECVIKLLDTVIAEGVSAPKGESNGITEIKSIECDGKDTTITLTLESTTSRYTVWGGTSVTDGSPCALVHLEPESAAMTYPKSW